MGFTPAKDRKDSELKKLIWFFLTLFYFDSFFIQSISSTNKETEKIPQTIRQWIFFVLTTGCLFLITLRISYRVDESWIITLINLEFMMHGTIVFKTVLLVVASVTDHLDLDLKSWIIVLFLPVLFLLFQVWSQGTPETELNYLLKRSIVSALRGFI